jgi:hypothetical protein
MHIPDCSKGSVEVERGGFADVSQGTYQGRLVAIKVVRVYITSDLDAILSVSLILLAPQHLCGQMIRRVSVGRELPGSTSGIRMSYRCSE